MLLLILQSLSKWLEIKAIRAHWDLSREIERYCETTENAIIEARAAGNDAVADRLRSRLSSAAGIAVPAIRDSASADRANISGLGK